MARIAGLAGPYIKIRRNKNGVITYGGDQGFFAGAPKDSEDERKRSIGCGMVAFGDLLLYLAGQDSGYCFEEISSYVNQILPEQSYKDYFNYIYGFLGGLPAKHSNGLSGFRLQGGFNRMARSRKWRLRAGWGFSGKKIYHRMVEMLNRDIPVILCVPVILFKRDKEQGIPFYKKEENEYHKACTVSAHYVMVTEMIKENEDLYLVISSWGQKYYINWKEYEKQIHTHFLGTILGNILYIK